MGPIRNFLDKNPAASWIATGCLMAVAAVMIIRSQRGPGTGGEPVFYFDLNTQTLVVRNSKDISPYPGSPATFTYPDGEAGSQVRANIFACKGHQIQLKVGMSPQDVEAAGARLVSLQRSPTPRLEGLQNAKAGATPGEASGGEPRILMSGPAAKKWFSAESPRASKLLGVLTELCGKTPPRPVLP